MVYYTILYIIFVIPYCMVKGTVFVVSGKRETGDSHPEAGLEIKAGATTTTTTTTTTTNDELIILLLLIIMN